MKHRRLDRLLSGTLTCRQRTCLLTTLGLLGVLSAAVPCLDLRPPPMTPVDPTRATAAELLSLPGVGPSRARAILQYRARMEAGLPATGADPLAASWTWKITPFLTGSSTKTGGPR